MSNESGLYRGPISCYGSHVGTAWATYVQYVFGATCSTALVPFLLHLFSFPQATDGGGNKVTAPITITVADINDNKPVFQGPFDRTINESFALVETVGLCCGRLRLLPGVWALGCVCVGKLLCIRMYVILYVHY